MSVLRIGLGILLAFTLCLAGCGKEERAEAVRLTKLLTEKQPHFEKANAIEKELVVSAGAWCDGIVANGAGRGVELDQNSRIAAELAKSAVAASTELGQVRQAVYGESLQKEYPQSVRSELITQLTKRQRQLQDVRAMLEESAPQFSQYRESKAYTGDSYPGAIGKLDALLKAYKPPDDVVGTAIAGLKAKYKLTSNEL